MKFFYHKIIVIDKILEELHTLDLSDGERAHLAALVDSSLHHAILDEILSNLKDEDKRIFIKAITQNSEDDKLLEFLQSKIENIEEKIKRTADDLIVEMHKDIKEARLKK